MRSTGKISVKKTADFDFSVEIVDIGQNRVMTFVHLDVTHFSPAVFKKIKETFDFYRPNFPEIIYTQPSEYDAKFHKFMTRFGFKLLSDGVDPNGQYLPYYFNFKEPIGSDTD